MPMSGNQLKQEAAFADADYSLFADQLAVNKTFLDKYANPRHDWDWRQYAAKQLGDIKGKKVLDYGCGQGEESVYLAIIGADVTAIDISPVGIELANKRAKFNQVDSRLKAYVMRCDPTSFPDESFDAVHGFGILHHVGLQTGMREIKRLLKPGGKGIFFEHMGNSEFVEKIKHNDHYTDNEKPLRWQDVLTQAGEFRKFSAKPFHLSSRLRRRIKFFDHSFFKRLDYAILQIVPPARYFASGIVIYLEK